MQRVFTVSTRWSTRPNGFTLVEALVSISIAVLASSALMLSLASSLQTTQTSLEQIIGQGIAKQLIDEVLGKRYAAPGAGPYQTVLNASSYEMNGQARERYNDTDDYHGIVAQPPEDRWGIALGHDDGQGDVRHPNFVAPANYFDRWRQEIEVYYVSNSDPSIRLSQGQTSDHRAVEVHTYIDEGNGRQREIANLRRVYSYIPKP